MTQGSFDFVSLPKRVYRSKMNDRRHERFQPDLISGRLDLVLENKGLLLIAADSDDEGKGNDDLKIFQKSGGRPVIPGSSLKGVFRSLFEAVTPSCLCNYRKEYRQKKELISRPGDFAPFKNGSDLEPCSNMTKLCPACAVFGGMHKNDAWRGRVNIGDGRLVEGEPKFLKGRAMPRQLTPRPKARPGSKNFTDYYPNQTMAGRKFYIRPITEGKTVVPQRHSRKPTSFCEPLKPGHHFRFDLHFTNLSAAELGTLLRVLLLPEGLVHAVGAAKNHGWGSCRIEAESLLYLEPESRYRGMPGKRELHGEAMTAQLETWMAAASALFSEEAFAELSEMLTPGKRGIQ